MGGSTCPLIEAEREARRHTPRLLRVVSWEKRHFYFFGKRGRSEKRLLKSIEDYEFYYYVFDITTREIDKNENIYNSTTIN